MKRLIYTNIVRLIFSAATLIVSVQSYAQNTDEQLYNTLKAKDSLLFNIGFNTCDLAQFDQLLSEDFEFYHDIAGITKSKAVFIEEIKNGICKLNYKPRRELVESSLEASPLRKNNKLYGAIQTGVHRFYAIEKDGSEHLTSIAKFTSVWLLEGEQWKLSRCLSYEHKKSDNNLSDSLLFKDRAVTEQWLKKNRVPTLGLGYIKDGKIQEVTVYGEISKGVSAPKNTIFNVASLTKPITALVTLKLIDAGKWSLDDPVYPYFTDPDVVNDPKSKKLTTRHILSHQTGFSNWRFNTADGKLAFEFEPGTKYQYSGEGFEYLRKALESKFKKPLEELAEELVFKPLDMKDTRFIWSTAVDESRFAQWQDGQGNVYETYKNKTANAADDLLTTPEDYTKFMLHIMNGAGLSQKLYNSMVSEQVRINKNKYWGLGWWIDEPVGNKEKVLIHGGDDKGVHTIAFILPQSKEGLLIFTNCDNGTDVYIPIVKAYLGKTGDDIINIETK